MPHGVPRCEAETADQDQCKDESEQRPGAECQLAIASSLFTTGLLRFWFFFVEVSAHKDSS